MSVPVVCPECAKKLKAPDKARGKALKCPTCGGRVPVPAGDAAPDAASPTPIRKKKRPAAKQTVAAGGTGEFLTGLDLSRAEDRDTEVCPRCGTLIPEQEEGAELEECPKCGADLFTGGKGRTARRKERFKSRGEDPKVYYSTAAGDGMTFLKKNVDVAVRLSVLTLFASAIAGACWVIVVYCAHTPPKLFWGLPAVVATLFIPGCLWVLQEAVTGLVFENKQKFKRFRFDVLDCVAKAPRIVAWAGVALWPLTVIDLLAWAAVAVMDMPPVLVWGALGLHALAAFLCWPAGLGHMAMPVSSPGWNFAVVAKGTATNLGPALFWAALTFAAFLPALAVLGGAGAVSGNRVAGVFGTMRTNNAALLAAEEEAGGKEGAKIEYDAAEIDWNAFLIPGVALLPAAFLFGFAAVYASRPAGLLAKMFRPSLGLVTIAREKKYVPKLKRKDELADLDEPESEGLTWGTVGTILGVTAVLGLVIGFAFYMTFERVPLMLGLSFGLSLATAISALGAGITQIVIAFKEDLKWGIGHLVPIVNGFVSLAFTIMFWHRMKYVFVWGVGLVLLSIVASVLQVLGQVGAPGPAA